VAGDLDAAAPARKGSVLSPALGLGAVARSVIASTRCFAAFS
jgi:hypothetical protein